MTALLAMPVYGPMDPRVAASLMQSMTLPVEVSLTLQCPSVALARNLLAARFLRSTHERLVFVDSDMVWSPADLSALLARDEDVVGATYAAKAVPPQTIGEPLDGGETTYPLVEASLLGTGFLSLSRACVERVVTAHPASAFVIGRESSEEAGLTAHAIFADEVRDGRYYGEDATFCERWRALGGRLWIHTGVRPGHVGTHVYTLGVRP